MRGRLRSHRDGDGFEPLPERDSLVLNVSAEFEPEPEPEPQLDRGTLTPNLTGLAVAEIKKQGALRCRVDGGAERVVWMALTVDGALTMRDHLEDERGPRGRSVLRLASARRCKCQPGPAGTELRLLLWEPDEPKAKGEQAGREYVLSGFKPQGAKPKDRDVSDIEEWQAAFRWFEHRSATLHWQFAAMFGLPAPEKAATESAAEEDDVDEACLAKDDLQEFVINWCEKFHRFGFQIAVAERTEQTADRVVILLRMDDDEVLAHFRQLQIERWQNDADGIKLKKSPTGERREKNRAKELQEDLSIDQLTQQDRIFTMADVLSTRCRLGDIEHLHDRVYPFKPAPSEDERQSASRDHVGNKWKTTSVDPRIIDVMPLKDELWIERMGKLWSEKGGVIQSFRGWRDVIVKRRTLLQETLQAGTDMLEHGVSMAQQTVKTVNSEIEVHLERAHEHMEIARHISDPHIGKQKWRSPFVGCTLVVKNIPLESAGDVALQEEGLRSIFEPYGLYLQGTVVQEGLGGSPRGSWALVTFADQAAAAAALSDDERRRSPDRPESLVLEQLDGKTLSHDAPRLLKTARRKANREVARLLRLAPSLAAKASQEDHEQGQQDEPLRQWLDPEAPDPGADKEEKEASPERYKCCNSLLELLPEIMYAFQHRDDEILGQLKDEYGPKVSIYFAFLNSYTTSTGMLAFFGVCTFMIGYAIDWLSYLRILSAVGLATSCVWAPLALILWERRAFSLLFEWEMRDVETNKKYLSDPKNDEDDQHGVNIHYSDEDDRQLGKPLSYLAALIFGLILGLHFGFGLLLGLLAGFALLPCLRPWRLEVGEWAKKWLSVAVAVCLVIFGISFVLLGNFMVIEYTQYLTILPICDTYFHDIVERENEHTHGGLFSTNSTILPLGPDCFESQDPGSNPWNGLRGLLIFLVGIGAALLIDVVWDLVFRLMAEYILSVLNIRMQTDYDSARVWVYFPFMWFAFMSYFLLAAIMLPFGPFIDPYLLDLIHWWFEFGATVANTAREIGSAVTDVDQLTHVVGQSVQRVQHALSRGHSDPDDPAGILDDDLHDLNMTRVDDLMQYWRYNHRNANTLNTLMIGPLVVAVWLDFVFKNLMPFFEDHRRRYVALRRGKKLSLCPRLLVWITCCLGDHDSHELPECIDGPDGWLPARKAFCQELEKKLQSADSEHPLADQPEKKRVILVKQLPRKRRRQPEDQTGCCSTRCACKCCNESESFLEHAANYILLESSLLRYDAFFEYAELVGQFSYVTMFTIVFPLGSLMSLGRNLFEAQWDAYRMWRDFKRPVPSRPSQQHSLEGWEDTVRTQVTVACILTSGFFVFCTGQLEAWVDLLNGEVPADDGSASAGGFEVPADGRRTIADSVVSWRACHPVSRNETIWWTYGEDSQQQCSAESRLDTDNGTSITQSMDHLMAPNYNCWELAEERIPEDKVNVCEWSEQDFYSLGLGMGFHQISVRLLGWLLLNHIQFAIAGLVFRFVNSKEPEIVVKIWERENQQKKIMGDVLFGEKRRKLKKKLKRAASIAAGGARLMSRSSDMDTSVEVTDSSA